MRMTLVAARTLGFLKRAVAGAWANGITPANCTPNKEVAMPPVKLCFVYCARGLEQIYRSVMFTGQGC